MPDVVSAFLASIGLGLLEDTFAEHDIDEVTLFELDENDLKEMGVRMGPRRKLLAALRDAAASRPPPATARAAAPPPPPPPPPAFKVVAPAPTVGELKARLRARGIPEQKISACLEKRELGARRRARVSQRRERKAQGFGGRRRTRGGRANRDARRPRD